MSEMQTSSTGHESMVPPPGYIFIFSDTDCGITGCFRCTKIHCDFCAMKDRRSLELERKNTELVKYIEKLQHRLLHRGKNEWSAQLAKGMYGVEKREADASGDDNAEVGKIIEGPPPEGVIDQCFAHMKSPVLFDPQMNRMYSSITMFLPQ